MDRSKGDSMCNGNSSNSGSNNKSYTTQTNNDTQVYLPSSLNIANGETMKSNGNGNGNLNGNGVHRSADASREEESPSPSMGGRLVRLLQFLVWNSPLLASLVLLLLATLAVELWNGPLEKLLQSFYLQEDMTYLGTYKDLDPELTYYYRRCDHRDISTHDANDLLLNDNMTMKERRDIAMTHGAVVMKDLLSHETAAELRSYLETRHHKFHTTDLQLPWDELFWDGDGGSRLSLGLGPEDTPIVEQAIAEVGANPQLAKTLEAILGADPAVVEVSTLSTMHDAEPQGIHTDSDFFGSSVMYTRSFLHSYTMFISLQETTSRMGATTICPGTHWCADEDLESLCQCNFLDDDVDHEDPIGYCNTFEASSNGHTGLDVGVLKTGDAMMFNQNVWHRGPRNYDLDRPENRVMFIMTFVSRRDYEKGDNRQQGWGTYYYMRHSMWGHLFSDLKTAASGGMDLFRKRIWKAYGLVAASKKGNLPWLEHWARQLSNRMDFFMDGECESFRIMLSGLKETNWLAKWLFLDDTVLKYLFGDEAFYYDEEEDFDYIGWKDYLDLLVKSAHHQSQRLYFTVVAATVLANILVYALYCGVWWMVQKLRGARSSSRKAFLESPQPLRDTWRCVRSLVVGHLVVFGIALATRHYVLYKAPLFERIHSGDIAWEAFPRLPTVTGEEPEYNEAGEFVGTVSFTEQLFPLEVLTLRQEREQQEFRYKHPEHPYASYFEMEWNRLEDETVHSGYVTPKPPVAKAPQHPIQSTAFPERYDVLIGSRFDADYLASMNFVLDFHPGSKIWIQWMKEHQDAVANTADAAYLDMVADAIVSKVQGSSSLPLLSNEGGTPRRFLKQDHETGWWTVMTRTEAVHATKQALLAMAFPVSVGVSFDHWKQVLAESRFGKRRDTALAKTWIPSLVDKRTRELWLLLRKNGPSEDSKTMVSPMGSAEATIGTATERRGRILLPSTGRGVLPKSMITGKTALSQSTVGLIPPMVPPSGQILRQISKNTATLKIGDHILYKGADDSDQDLYFQATIVAIYAEHDELVIQPLRFDDVHEEFSDVTMLTHISHIQYYRPAKEGDVVWSLRQDPNGETTSWKLYELLFLTPFGQVDLVMTPEQAERFSASAEEPFENHPVGGDVKQFYLHGDVIPAIRLRQY